MDNINNIVVPLISCLLGGGIPILWDIYKLRSNRSILNDQISKRQIAVPVVKSNFENVPTPDNSDIIVHYCKDKLTTKGALGSDQANLLNSLRFHPDNRCFRALKDRFRYAIGHFKDQLVY